MGGKKFDWLLVLIISLLAQYFTLEILIYFEVRLFSNPSSSIILLFFNYFGVLVIGGILASHLYIKDTYTIGGICGAVYYILHRLYYGYEILSFFGLFTLATSFAVGYLGAKIYQEKIKKSNRTNL